MNKIAFIFLTVMTVMISAQKKDILKSQDINEIEQFLKTAHPEDPRRSVLKPKLIALKNRKWTEGAKTAKPMPARPLITEIPNAVANRPNSTEAEEFRTLMAESSDAHKAKTVKLLNTLFDQDANRKEAIVLVQNNSDCNLILRLKGEANFYNLAVPAKGENTMILNKGIYQVSTSVCDVSYTSTKTIKQNEMIILNQPIYEARGKTSTINFDKNSQK